MRTLVEFKHLAAGNGNVTAIGDVLTGHHPGRKDDAQITIFDSSGIALQVLFVVSHLIAAFEALNQGLSV